MAGVVDDNELTLAGEIDRAASLLEHYDRNQQCWNLPKDSEFWQAAKLARDLGQTGQGRTVAIVDSQFDIERYAALAPHTLAWGSDFATGPWQHGTAVALLVLEVAPEVELLLYPIHDGESLSASLAAEAVRDATARGADVINLSIARAFKTEDVFDVDRFVAGRPANGALFWHWLAKRSVDSPITDWLTVARDEVGEAVRDAHDAGVIVVAATGNHEGRLCAPAIFPETLSVGLRQISRSLTGGETGMETVAVEEPSFTQSALSDILVTQPDAMLGSSFATPLLSGFIAAMREPREIWAFRDSMRRYYWASQLQNRRAPHTWVPDRDGMIDGLYRDAVLSAPHQHTQPDQRSACAECSLLMLAPVNDYGLFKLNWNDLVGARTLLAAAKNFAPHRYEPRANLAVAMQELGRRPTTANPIAVLASALSESAAAVALRPGYEPYWDTCRELYAEVHAARNNQIRKVGHMETTEIRIRVESEEDIAAAREVAATIDGTEVREASAPPGDGYETAMEPVTSILVGVAVASAAVFLRGWWERLKGGLVIDQRPDAVEPIYRTNNVPYGYIVTYPADGGKATIDVRDAPKDEIERLIELALGGVFKSIIDLRDKAAEIVGADKVEAESAA